MSVEIYLKTFICLGVLKIFSIVFSHVPTPRKSYCVLVFFVLGAHMAPMEERRLCLSADDIFCTMHQVPPWSSAPVSLPAGVHLRATLYVHVHVGISDLSILHRRKPTLGLASLLLGKRSEADRGFPTMSILKTCLSYYYIFFVLALYCCWCFSVAKSCLEANSACRLQRIGTIKEDVHKKRFFWKIPRLILVL